MTLASYWLFGSFFDRGERSAQFLAASSALIFFLSGVPWPFAAMPAPLAALAQLLPSTAGVQSLVKINQMDAQMADVLPELGTLAALLALYASLALRRYLKKPQRRAMPWSAR